MISLVGLELLKQLLIQAPARLFETKSLAELKPEGCAANQSTELGDRLVQMEGSGK